MSTRGLARGANCKGLASETGQRKRAFFVLSEYYQTKAAEH
ncbi:hypothetical protein ABI_29590 [Asticcacaulis biprosthecium C19]|uniref:Uncharacterized protein n=1 Tax=Asticcacaulis biprosthecium C19 TaxID=715226 RepID=F4QMV1_9CAUL|nr:hypothetical protein ABI_29590 [Asticcacaulis biprosthecium C19]